MGCMGFLGVRRVLGFRVLGLKAVGLQGFRPEGEEHWDPSASSRDGCI